MALGWAHMGSWGGLSDPPISSTRTPLQAIDQPPPEKPIYALSIALYAIPVDIQVKVTCFDRSVGVRRCVYGLMAPIQVNPLDVPPRPKKSFHLTPISTPMGYQVIILPQFAGGLQGVPVGFGRS